jgi:hypothetical protein
MSNDYGILADAITDEHIRAATKEELDKTLNSEAIGWGGDFELNNDVVYVIKPGEEDGVQDTIADVRQRAKIRGAGSAE